MSSASAAMEPTVSAGDSPSSPASADPRAVLPSGALIGRYVVLETAGRGAMGIVYAAHDRALDRKVALKLMRRDDRGDGDGPLREARSLAKVTHPNVVAVHEVDGDGERMWVAMEFVDGDTLREWLTATPRTPREIVAAFIDAGRGLAAAHDAGVIHGDFKPDNVLVGRDGRVRVVDFGLARLAVPPPTDPAVDRIGGTPSYMAPELHLTHRADAATDQFAFGVALIEALAGRRPFTGTSAVAIASDVMQGRIDQGVIAGVPRRLRPIALRAIATAPADRFASVTTLVDALARTQQGRGGAALLGAAALASAGAVALAWPRAHADSPCSGAAAEYAATWNDRTRDAVRQGLATVDVPYADTTAGTVVRGLDDHAAQWIAEYTAACEATAVRHEQSNAVLDRRMACLARNRQRTDALVHVLAAPTRTVVERAITATASLPSPARCGDAATIDASVEPPREEIAATVDAAWAELERAAALEDGGVWPAARELADALVRDAEELGYLPLVAHARVRAAALAMRTGDAAAAATIAEAGFVAALEAGDAAAEVESAAIRGWASSEGLATLDVADQWSRIALAAARRVDRDGLLEARALTTGAVVASVDARHEPALALHETSLGIRERLLPASHPDLAINRAGIGAALLGLGRFDEAVVVLERVVADRIALYGEGHPQLIGARINLANARMSAGKLDDARRDATAAIALAKQTLDPDHPSLATAYELLALVEDLAGRREIATEVMLEVLAIRERRFGPQHSQVAKALNNLGGLYFDQGRLAESEAVFARAVAIDDAQPGASHPDVAVRRASFAITLAALGKADEARHQLARAWELVGALPEDDGNRREVERMRQHVERRLAGTAK